MLYYVFMVRSFAAISMKVRVDNNDPVLLFLVRPLGLPDIKGERYTSSSGERIDEAYSSGRQFAFLAVPGARPEVVVAQVGFR